MRNKLYRAMLKSITGRLSVYLVQFLSLTIYARLFTPYEFGIIASIQVFVTFFQMLADIGVGPAIINEDEFESNKRDGVFTVTAITGALLALLFFFFSYALNSFYSGYEYQEIAIFVCIAILFYSLNIVPMTAMSKDTKFMHLASVDIFVECLSLAVVYLMYVEGYGLLALASRPAIQGVVRFLLIWSLSSKTELGRASFGSEIHHIKPILSFSLYQFGFSFINYFSRNLDNILIAKYFGMASVGLYEKAYQLMRYPLMVTTFAMTPAIQPILTKVRGDMAKVVEEHNLLTARLLFISLPISAFLYLNSHSIVLFIFGDQWIDIESLIKIFSFMIPIQAVLSTSGSFFQVMNKPKLLFISGAISASVNVTGIIIGIYLGRMEFVAYALVITFALNFFQCYYIMFKHCFKQSSLCFYKKQFSVFLAMCAPIALYTYTNSFIDQYMLYNVSVDLFINMIVGGVCLLLFYLPLKRTILQ